VETFLGNKGQVKNVDRRGKRRMAYEINKKNHGAYTVFSYKAEGNVVAELEHRLNLNENVLRFLSVARELTE
jgi:small subunit ribosomal protein S6